MIDYFPKESLSTQLDIPSKKKTNIMFHQWVPIQVPMFLGPPLLLFVGGFDVHLKIQPNKAVG